MRALFLAPVVVAMLAGPAVATPRCMVRADSEAIAVEAPDAKIVKGATFGPVTTVQIERATNVTSYCGHGSFCYPAGALTFISPCTLMFDPQAPGSEVAFFNAK